MSADSRLGALKLPITSLSPKISDGRVADVVVVTMWHIILIEGNDLAQIFGDSCVEVVRNIV
jgi:hypothetical protein